MIVDSVPTVLVKRCHRCETVKQFGEFTRDRQKKDGLRSYCRSCSSTAIESFCAHCGVSFRRPQHRKYCGQKCRAAANIKTKFDHPTYKGRVKHAAGYVRVWEPSHPLASSDGYVLEHRKVIYDAGIALPDWCHVHHINGDKADNRRENLEVLTAAQHKAQHTPIGALVKNQFGEFLVHRRRAG